MLLCFYRTVTYFVTSIVRICHILCVMKVYSVMVTYMHVDYGVEFVFVIL
jgi:hypothetical protein